MLVILVLPSGRVKHQLMRNPQFNPSWRRLRITPGGPLDGVSAFVSIARSRDYNPRASALMRRAIHGDVVIVDPPARNALRRSLMRTLEAC